MKPSHFSKAMAWGAILCVLPSVVLLLFAERSHLGMALSSVPRIPLLLSAVMVAAAWLCHMARVRITVGALGYTCSWADALRAAMGMELGVAVTPGGIGGAVLKTTFLHKTGVPVAHCLGLIATDWLFDTLLFAIAGLVGMIAVVSDPLWHHMLKTTLQQPISAKAWVWGLMASVVILALVWTKRWFFTSGVPLDTDAAIFSNHSLKNVHTRKTRLREIFRDAGTVLPRLTKSRPWVVPACLFFAVIQGTCRFGVLPLLVYSLNPEINVLPLFPLQGLLWALSLVVVVPGGGGGAELLSLFFLKAMVAHSWAFTIVFIWRFFTFHLYWAVGAAVVLPALWKAGAYPPHHFTKTL